MTTSTRLLEQFAKWARASGPEPAPNRPKAVMTQTGLAGSDFAGAQAENVGDVAAPREGAGKVLVDGRRYYFKHILDAYMRGDVI